LLAIGRELLVQAPNFFLVYLLAASILQFLEAIFSFHLFLQLPNSAIPRLYSTHLNPIMAMSMTISKIIAMMVAIGKKTTSLNTYQVDSDASLALII
jgi:hypothetical protein